MKNIKKIKLENGVRAIFVPQKSTKVATVLILVKTGSKNEEKKISGISHFLEHMLFKGTKKRKTPLKVAEDLDKVGGVYNAFTGEDYTGYYAKVKSSHIDLAVDWVSDIYLNSVLPSEEVEKEKGVIKEEINMYYDNPITYCQLLFQKLLYGDQPAGWDIAGTKESVSRISREDLLKYRDDYYIGEGTVVVISGNINQKETEKKIREIFSSVKSGSLKEKEPVVENQSKPELLNFYKKTDQTHFCLGIRAFNIFHENRYTQEILAALLGGMMSSRLFIKIRDELGLAYYIRTSIDSNPDTGVLVTQAGVDNKKIEKAISAILKEYKSLKENKISAKELIKTKEYLKGKAAIYFEGSDAMGRFYGMTELLENETYSIEEVFSQIDKVTAKDVQDLAKTIFKKENLNLAVVGPVKEDKELQKLLKI